ncbi:tetratricopeptide repeat protein, partial [Candidatus Poribacteria bacterium]|nr:tetratricopeptide repeat protein [Candidatus Poribacteria bacterium]
MPDNADLETEAQDGPSPEAQKAIAQRFVDRARRYGERGNHRAAIEAYRNALQLTPTSVELFFELGNAYSSVGEHPNATVMYEAAVEQLSEWP